MRLVLVRTCLRARHALDTRDRGVIRRRARKTAAITTASLLGWGLAVVVAPVGPVAQAAPVGQGFNINVSDLRFILQQIKIPEPHAAMATADNPCGSLRGDGPDQIPTGAQGEGLPWGLRTVDGTCNNLVPGQERFGAAEQVFPRRAAADDPKPQTVIRLDTRSNQGRIHVQQLGVNHRFSSNGYGMWDPEKRRPRPVVVKRLREGGVSLVRYPGGIVGNLFDWKNAVGPIAQRGCQTRGHWRRDGYAAAKGLSYGPDEHMRFVRAIGAKASIVVPYVTETPADAADWVEYMNSKNDGPYGRNPNGGADWAYQRAKNGHPAPYGVRLWEVGNEQRVKKQRYWMSQNTDKAMHQYIHGATVPVRDEALGKNCRHPNDGVRTNGQKNQVFEVRYPPIAAGSLDVRIGADGAKWEAVSEQELANAAPYEKFFAVDHEEGMLTFGDGVNGSQPPRNSVVHADYRSTHKGVFAFIEAMREVDPRIKVCPTWGLEEFISATRGRRYNCFSVHSYTHFRAEGSHNWGSAVRGHDLHMLGVDKERESISNIKHRLPRRTPIALTEFGAIWGNSKVFPEWASSMTHALYMASMWTGLLDLGIPWATGSDLVAPSYRGLLGKPPRFVNSAEALVREAIVPMYKARGRRIKTAVSGNPLRRARGKHESYLGLTVVATRSGRRNLYLSVVNRLPNTPITATIELDRPRARGRAYVTRVKGSSFRSRNTSGRPGQVKLRRHTQRIQSDRFVHTFPASSVSVIRIPIKTGRR